MKDGRRGTDSAGFTLVEVLVALVVMSLVGVAVASLGIAGVNAIGEGNRGRDQEAVTRQWVSIAFARDVQGASTVVAPTCSGGSPEPRDLALQASDGSAVVEYDVVGTGPYSIVRTDCSSGGSRLVADELAVEPRFTCDGAPCVPPDDPRRITVSTGRTADAEFLLDGSRRTTDGHRSGPPTEVPDFVALGGSMPLWVSGNGSLEVLGAAYVNLPDGVTVPPEVTVVRLDGGGALDVSGDFRLQAGGRCPDCATNANKQPGSFPDRMLDPLRFLPEPDRTGMPVRTDCPIDPLGNQRVCLPGVYPGEFPPAGGGGGGVKEFRLEPGIYVLDDGMKVTNGSVTGDGVLLFNASGRVDVSGADLDVEPSTTGMYRGLLLFQGRANDAPVKIVGNAQLASFVGTIYAPGSDGVVLGGGNGELRVGRVIGAGLEVSGDGTVIVDGG